MTDFRTLLVEKPGMSCMGFRIFERIKVREDLFMSIQGHSGAYCEPREAVDVFDYESMEAALMKEDGTWVSPQAKNWPPELKKFDGDHWSECDDVAGWVPIAILQEVYDILTGGPPVIDVEPPSEPKASNLSDWIKSTLLF